MTNRQKRIVLILIGIIFVVGSLMWMKHSANTNPIPALVFAAGLIAILDTVKQVMRDITRKSKQTNMNDNR